MPKHELKALYENGEVTCYFDGQEQPFGHQEFQPESPTAYLFSDLLEWFAGWNDYDESPESHRA